MLNLYAHPTLSSKHAPIAFQVVLSHTPYRELAKELGDKPVVISGRGAHEVAKAYGFTRAVTTAQLSAAYPTAVPFCHSPGLPAAAAQGYVTSCNECLAHVSTWLWALPCASQTHPLLLIVCTWPNLVTVSTVSSADVAHICLWFAVIRWICMRKYLHGATS